MHFIETIQNYYFPSYRQSFTFNDGLCFCILEHNFFRSCARHGCFPCSQIFGWIYIFFGPLGPLLIAYFAKHQSQKGHYDANMTAGMLVASSLSQLFCLFKLHHRRFGHYILRPCPRCREFTLWHCCRALPVITPPHLRARVAAVYMLTGAIGMMFGPPLAGAFNEFISRRGRSALFNDHDDLFLWITRVLFLHLGRKHYALSMKNAEGGWSLETWHPHWF